MSTEKSENEYDWSVMRELKWNRSYKSIRNLPCDDITLTAVLYDIKRDFGQHMFVFRLGQDNEDYKKLVSDGFSVSNGYFLSDHSNNISHYYNRENIEICEIVPEEYWTFHKTKRTCFEVSFQVIWSELDGKVCKTGLIVKRMIPFDISLGAPPDYEEPPRSPEYDEAIAE
tara:strand:- start:1186 stop:1698 length:513 start_codon:yes stop_codon:yes gene_type:complete